MTVSARSLANVRLKVTPAIGASKASQAVAEAGFENSAYMTALRTKQQSEELIGVAQSDTWASYAAVSGGTTVKLLRAKDRLFVGRDLNDNDGQEFFESGGKDWLETLVPSTSTTATIVALSPVGYGGIAGATRTSDNPLVQSEGSWAVGGFAFANKAGNFTAYGALFEARRYGDAGYAHGFEADAISLDGTSLGLGSVTTPKIGPMDMFPDQHLVAGWFSIARPLEGGDVTAGIAIVNNAGSRKATAGRAKTGLVIAQEAILGQDGSYAGVTEGDAIALGLRHRHGWVSANSANELAAFITSSVTIASAQAMEFLDGGILFRQKSGPYNFIIDSDEGGTHYGRIRPGTASVNPRLYVAGSGSKNLELSALGGGTVDLQGSPGVLAFRAYSVSGHANGVQVSANAAGFSPSVFPVGTDANINLTLSGKGTGTVVISGLPTSAAGLPTGALWNNSGVLNVA